MKRSRHSSGRTTSISNACGAIGIQSVALLLSLIFFMSCSQKSGEITESPGPEAGDSTTALSGRYYTDCKHLLAEARIMDSVLMTRMELETPVANKAIKAFTDYAYYCRNDSLSPVYLIKTAQVAKAVNNIPQAKLVLDHVMDQYPRFNNLPAALFLLAQLYDEDTYLNDEYEAARLYQRIIDEYPESDWTASARGAIRFLGKSDEEILKELKNKKH